MKKINFVYITTNLINKKQYVGEHTTDTLNDEYLGSGIYFQRALNEYGKENFQRKILEFFDTKKEAFDAQEKYIKKHNTLFPIGYNISPTGGHNIKGCFSEESKQKLREKAKLRTGIKNSFYGKHHTEETKQKIGQAEIGNKKFKGKTHTKESREKISNALRGKPTWNTGKRLSEEHKQHLRKPKSEEHKQHLRKPKSEIGRQNIKIAHNTSEYFQKISKIHKGKIVSVESKKKMSDAAKKRKPISEKTRKKMAQSQKRRFSK